MKLEQLINFIPVYEKLKDHTMSLQLAYRLTKIYRVAKEEEDFYRNKLQEILKEYAQLDENGNFIQTDDGAGIKIKPETQPQCIAAINELSMLESTAHFDPIPLGMFGTEFELTGAEMGALMPFIQD